MPTNKISAARLEKKNNFITQLAEAGIKIPARQKFTPSMWASKKGKKAPKNLSEEEAQAYIDAQDALEFAEQVVAMINESNLKIELGTLSNSLAMVIATSDEELAAELTLTEELNQIAKKADSVVQQVLTYAARSSIGSESGAQVLIERNESTNPFDELDEVFPLPQTIAEAPVMTANVIQKVIFDTSNAPVCSVFKNRSTKPNVYTIYKLSQQGQERLKNESTAVAKLDDYDTSNPIGELITHTPPPGARTAKLWTTKFDVKKPNAFYYNASFTLERMQQLMAADTLLNQPGRYDEYVFTSAIRSKESAREVLLAYIEAMVKKNDVFLNPPAEIVIERDIFVQNECYIKFKFEPAAVKYMRAFFKDVEENKARLTTGPNQSFIPDTTLTLLTAHLSYHFGFGLGPASEESLVGNQHMLAKAPVQKSRLLVRRGGGDGRITQV